MGKVINAMPEPPKRGRKSKDEIPPEARSMDLVAQDQRDQQITAVKAFEAFGVEGKDYDLVTYTQMGRNVFQLHGMTGLMGGRILLVIKANETQGTFLKALEQIGIHPRMAQRYMHTAKRFGKYDNLSHLPNSKLAVLEELSDPELEKLDAGADVLGLNLDAIEKTPATQLRERVRKAEQKLKLKTKEYQEDVKKMSAELGELRLRLSGQEPPTKEQIAGDALNKLTPDYSIAIAKVSGAIREAYALAVRAEKIEGVNVQQLSEWLNQFGPDMQTFHDLCQTWTDEADNAGPIKDWRISDLPGKEEAGVPNLG
jgi:hypothetical protein